MFTTVRGLAMTATVQPPRALSSRLPALPFASNGNWTFMATCQILEEGQEVAKVVGYDVRVTIARDVENACRLHKPRRSRCTPAELVLLPRAATAGEIFYLSGGTVRRLT